MTRALTLILCASLASGCVAKAIKAKKVETAMNELWVEKNLDSIEKYYTENAAGEVEQFMRESLAAWPDPKITIDDIIIDGDRVVVEWTVVGKHRDLDQVVTLSGVNVATIKGVKVDHEVRYFDNLVVMDQLGYQIVPPDMGESDDWAPAPEVPNR